ncbi:MAG: hypothetical protein MUP85_16600 [Candidatus Lokiarchaeota archaeon]|nr:hypothetical protein [Candidatus Lokiarchaeota archaeon]
MFKSLYIMDENGLLLYSKNFIKHQYDENILIGFFTSIANFSREALGGVVKNLNLGQNNKLILLPNMEERLLGAAIVGDNDNEDLISRILKNILQDFVDTYSPEYEIEKILEEEMQHIIDSNLSGNILHSPLKRLILSWIIVGPLTYPLILLSIYATNFIYLILDLNRFLNQEFLFTRFLPALILLSIFNIMILYLIPNFVLGYLSPNWKIAFLSSIIYVGVSITVYFFSSEPNFAYIVISNLPLAVIFSLFFLFVGARYSRKKFLT